MREKIKFKKDKPAKAISLSPALFSVSEGDTEGEIDLQWDPVTEATFYIIQICIYSAINPKWVQVDIITRSSYTISDLKSGKQYCFRISAGNPTGLGPWSEVIKKNAP